MLLYPSNVSSTMIQHHMEGWHSRGVGIIVWSSGMGRLDAMKYLWIMYIHVIRKKNILGKSTFQN